MANGHGHKAGLTFRNERFIQLYVLYGIAGQAHREAGYKARDHDQGGYWMLQKPQIVQRIKEVKLELAEKSGVTKEEAVKNLTKVMRYAESETLRMQAIAQLSRMLGWDQPTKVVIESDPLLEYLREVRTLPAVNRKETIALEAVCSPVNDSDNGVSH